MDRYLYRAMIKDTSIWLTGYLDCNHHKYCIKKINDIISMEITPHTICQCIGKPDKEKNLLFEYDIVKCQGSWIGDGIYVIKWNNEYTAFGLYDAKRHQFENKYHGGLYQIPSKHTLKMGNVFEDQTYWDLMKDEIMSININNK